MKKILVSGSTAYDFLMKYNGDFREEFRKGDINQGVNTSILVSELDKTTGGTGLNICYNLALLGEYPILITSV
jgi:adenosine kinase